MSALTSLRAAAAARIRAFSWRRPVAVTGSILAAAGHVWVLFNAPVSAATAIWVLPLLVIAPGLVTMILLHGGRRWYRWAGILALTGTTDPEYLPYVLITVEAWALHRHWFVERDKPLRDLFTLRRKAPKTA